MSVSASRPNESGGQRSFDAISDSVDYVYHPRAKRYRLFLQRSGRPRVTIPRRGSRREAELFVGRHRAWLLAQGKKFAERQAPLKPGDRILVRGALVEIRPTPVAGRLELSLGGEVISTDKGGDDLTSVLAAYLRRLAERELPPRLFALAAQHAIQVRRLTIRNQRSRWGSASRRGTISLNWRLIQAPPEISDYVMLHELMHLREMNHSPRFWKHVADVCPDYRKCRDWLRRHQHSLDGWNC